MIGIDFETFEKHMKDIENVMRFQDSIRDACKEASSSEAYCEILFPSLIDNVVELLALMTQDMNGWIDYFILELDFGKEYKDGCVVDLDGSNIQLKTTHDLWDILSKERQS